MEINCKVNLQVLQKYRTSLNESEKERLEPHAKPLSELEQVSVEKIHKGDNRMSLLKYKRSLWNTTKE